ncbi:MAG: serine/threonine-protein kinase [Myxococcota bacterium]
MLPPTTTEGIPFGRYQIRHRLGSGGMGEVFLADQLGPLGPVRPVALKRMQPTLAHDPAHARRFLQEMAIAARLNHPNIAVTHDFGEIEGVYYMAMEYIEGASMDQALEKGPLPIAAALQVTRQIAEALAHAHDRSPPVVHQDVSPHNIMIGTGGEVKLLDFGIAAAEAAAQDKLRVKAPYAAPEQLRGLPPQRHFDLWALGVVLYEMLTGRRPFSGTTAHEVIKQIEQRALIPVEALVPSAAGASQLIRRALNPRPSRRWDSAQAFADACELLLARREASAQQTLATRAAQSRTGPVDDWHAQTSTVAPPLSDADADAAKFDAADDIAPSSSRRYLRRWGMISLLAGTLLWLALVRVFDPVLEAFRPTSQRVPRPIATNPQPPVTRALLSKSATSSIDRKRAQSRPEDRSDPDERPRRPRVPSKRRRQPSASVAPTPAASNPIQQPGMLSIRSTPWCRVELDGRSIGEGIIAARPIAAGEHVVRLVPGEGSYPTKSIRVRIFPGRVTKIFADFGRDRVQVLTAD